MMARKGRGAQALATAAIGSFVAGTIATLALSFVAPQLVKLALLFGPAEYFALMVLALTTVTAVLGDSLVRGLASLFIGLALGLVGIDLQTGQARFTMGVLELLDGIDTVVVAVGLFAIGETLYAAARHKFEKEEIYDLVGSVWMSAEDWARSWKPWLRGTFLGFPIGALPAGGSEIPTFLSYLVEKRLAKNPEEFGKGAIEAVAGPEAANNAAVAGTLAPLLSLGLPTSATAAIMLAAFQQYGLQPGPLLFESSPDLVWGLIASLYIGNVLLLVLNLPMAGVWVKLLHIPKPWLYAGILVFATMGAYTLNNNVVDLMILWIIGILGFGMRVLDVPVAPCVVGLILGPLAEQQFRRALSISQGDLSVFFTHPISLLLLAIAVLLVITPIVLRRRQRQPRLRHRLTRPPSSRNTAMLESLTSLFTLTVLEVVLSIDNLVVIAVLVGKLPKDQQANARYVGMTLALLPRLVLLVFIGWIIGLTEPLFTVFGHGVSGKDLILAAGGLFLIYKATHEIHSRPGGRRGRGQRQGDGQLRGGGGADRDHQPGVLDRQHRHRGRHGQRDLDHGGGGDPVDDGADVRVRPGRHLRRGASDREDPGAGLSDHDRHGPGRRQLRRARAQGLHLHRDGVLGVHRADQHEAAPQGQAGPPAQPLWRGDRDRRRRAPGPGAGGHAGRRRHGKLSGAEPGAGAAAWSDNRRLPTFRRQMS